MPTIVERGRTVELLRGEFGEIAGFCRGLGPGDWATPTCLPGWSVHDTLAHMVGTESALAGGEVPSADISHLEHPKNPVAEVNEAWVESMRPWSDAQLLDRFEAVTKERLSALDAMSQADFDAPSWTPVGKDETYGRFMRIRHFDCFMHEQDMRLAVG
ncbi:MAG: maleylpyruvate isomerase family mycothiol-dependent enzyme, partial [Acidimicrobiales bacterium]|nr:maleylpyruvate isomerase family mycothiol-dependent enzyme [Acidimicrobiales bacterium]